MAEYEPFIIAHAQGNYLFDHQGNRYLDGVSSLWCNLFGHRHSRLDAALRRQLDQVAHVTNLGLSNPTTIQLAQELAAIAPAGLEHVFFSDDGATAIEVALKLALQYQRQRPDPQPSKTGYIALGDAYHGDTLGSVSVGGVQRFHAMFEPLLFPVHRLPAPTTYRLPNGITSEQATQYYLKQLEELLEREHQNIAAMIIEPLMQCAAGMIAHPPGYLRGVRTLTAKYNVLLIADEVAVGMGRTGKMFACEHEAVVPDLLCLAKGLTGGYLPLAATIATTTIWNAFLGTTAENRTFYHGHTYGGNPLGAAVARETLAIFREEQILAQLPEKIALLQQLLAPLLQRHNVGDIRQQGLIVGIELVADRATKTPLPFENRHGWKICQRILKHGIWLRPLGNTLVIFPPLSITPEELRQIVAAIQSEIDAEFAKPTG